MLFKLQNNILMTKLINYQSTNYQSNYQSTKHQSSKTILIVDDTPNNLQLLFKYLKEVGYRVLIAQNGEKAIKTALAIIPDLILLDVMMPGIDGFDTCSHLKENVSTKDIPIIFMTALAETKYKLKGFKIGAVDYITKPIEREELLARIETHLALQSLHQRLVKDAARQKLLFEISDRIRQSLDLKSILKTATQEIRACLDCDSVWLAHAHTCNKNIEIEAYASNVDPNIDLQTIVPWDYLCPGEEEYQHYLAGKIQIIDHSLSPDGQSLDANKVSKISFPFSFENRLILPILIPVLSNSPRVIDARTVNHENVLWGWLIADQYQSARQWQTEEIDLLKGLTTQLAIAIRQGLMHQQLAQQASIDPLTLIYNRRHLNQQIDLEWRRLQRVNAPMSLIMCDVDSFKIYNDTYGHQKGDECLQQIAKALSTVLKRPADILARYGGEEFTVVLPQTPQYGAIKLAEAMRVAVKDLRIPHVNSSVNSIVTISIGIASTVPSSEDNPQLLLEAADLALYKAKGRGRDCIAIYPEPISQSKDRQELELRWVQRLRQALKHNLFSLYAQAITPLEISDQKRYFEILLRLTDEDGQAISPNVFLDIANRNFLMPDIDTWVINTLLETLAVNPDPTYWQNHRFAINLSGASLNQESFLKFLSQRLKDYHLPPNLFCFEITETVAVSELKKVGKFIQSLKNLGCSFALDDFGTGMSSLTYLKNLPVDYLKIDGSFIRELNDSKSSKVMVEAINHIAEGIGLKTVAEYVENQHILDTVKDLKIDYAQGYHLGRPGVLMKVIDCC